MSPKRIPLCLVVLITLAGALAWIGGARAAQARAQAALTGASSCLSCHENLYYLHDLGNYYCLTEASARCIDCHAGDPQALQKDPAHAGLVAYPIVNGDISRCQACHQQDAQAHVETFAELAGFSPNIHVAAPVRPVVQAEAPAPQRPTPAARTWVGVSALLAVIASLLAFCFLTHRACRGQG